ncbi:hypothetical protein LCGC14_2219060 [marine sediment metagenome]|uniref:Flagellar basal body rod protein N-terminal domain-containing protein n=1 Tax=marine sediment metagenome TaxID=412755 RepID=A0A0F9DBI2_9ZZZZ
MLRAFSTAATGMVAQQMIVDTIANNLANINTVGFKRSQVDFHDLMYVRLLEPGRETPPVSQRRAASRSAAA